MPIAAIAPVVVLLVAYVAWIIYDIMHTEVQRLPRWGWILVTVFSVPLGGVAYLVFGRPAE